MGPIRFRVSEGGVYLVGFSGVSGAFLEAILGFRRF